MAGSRWSKKQRGADVQGRDAGHLLVGELEVEDVDVITDGKVKWEPAIDVNRLIGAVVVAALFVALRIVKIRTTQAKG